MEIADLIKSQIKEVFSQLYGVELADVGLEHPQSSTWGDYSSNVALINAKKLGKSPGSVAKELVDSLKKSVIKEYFVDINYAGPGFINFKLAKQHHIKTMFEILLRGDAFGSSDVGKGLRVALEHSNVNPNKATHIGHLRNAVLGQFMERVYEFINYDVKVQYYANDLGVQVSTSLLGLKELGSTYDVSKYPKYDHFMWDIYADISSRVGDSPDLKQKLDKMLVDLDSREPKISQEQKELSRKVLKDNILSFADLEVTYDLIVYESSIKDMQMWEKTFSILKNNNNVYLATSGKSAGCWLVRMDSSDNKKDVVDTEDIEEDKIIVRSNGIPTYTGKDIAYHMWKFGLLGSDFTYLLVKQRYQKSDLYETSLEGVPKDCFTPSDIVIDIIDVKQTYAIDAVRKSLEYLGYISQANNLIHVNYGHVYLSKTTAKSLGYEVSEGEDRIAMSGRRGLGVKIDDFVAMVDNRLKQDHGDFPNLKLVRNSAIKFDMLRYDTFQDVVFDIDSALNFKGFTGPYIQYTHARANSLLDKSGYSVHPESFIDLEEKFAGLVLGASEQEVLKTLYKFPEVVLESAKKYAPNLICNYLYDVCQKFNSFYNDSPIISAQPEELKEFRLILTSATKQVIKTGLYLLGITAVDRM